MISAKFPHIARTVKADKTVEIKGAVYIGDNCRLASHVRLESRGGRLIIGDNSIIGENTSIIAGPERTILGTDLQIGKNCLIEGSVGHGTKIGDNVTIKPTVIIGRNCQIGENQTLESIILDDGTSFINGEVSN